MAKIVYMTNGMASTLHSGLEWSRRLESLGHRVLFLGNTESGEMVQRHGFEWIQLSEGRKLEKQFFEERDRFRSGNGWSRWRQLFRRTSAIRQRSLVQTELLGRLEVLKPDLLIIDIELHVAILACSKLAIPMLLPVVWFSVFRARSLPPMHTGFMPDESFKGRARIWWSWQRLLIGRRISQAWEQWSVAGLKRRFRPISPHTNKRGDLQAVARIAGVDFDQETSRNHWLTPHVYPRRKVVCFNAWELEFPHAAPDGIDYVGPMVRLDRKDTAVDEVTLESWLKFRAKSEADGRGIIYASLGTFWSTNVEFLKKLIQVVGEEPGWALVIGLGGKIEPIALGELPETVLALRFAPQVEVLSHVKAAITHGGITTINECIEAGVPMLVCSTGQVDQDGCAARVAYHGLGVSLEPHERNPDRLRRALRLVLEDDAMRNRVLRMRTHFRGYRERQAAEKVVEQALNTTS